MSVSATALLILAVWVGVDLLALLAWVSACLLAERRAERQRPFFPILDEPLRGFQRELDEWDGLLPRWLEDGVREDDSRHLS